MHKREAFAQIILVDMGEDYVAPGKDDSSRVEYN